jgi:RNA polymerase sigma-70 factor (ECF subfamily)
MIDHIRKKKAAGSIENLAEQEGSEMFQPYSDLREILDDALDKLNEVQRSLILLRDYEGYSYHEISEITGLNESQVKVYIYRGRMFLKNYIVSPEHVI